MSGDIRISFGNTQATDFDPLANLTAAAAKRHIADSSNTPPLPGGFGGNPASLPPLPGPMGGLSLENLLKALGDDVRRQACRDGVTSLDLKASEQKDINEKQLQEIAKQLEDMAKQKTLNAFLKAFSIIGVIIGTIASAASIVAGALTANPLLITAGVVGMAMSIDGIASLASDGKYSLMAGFAELGKACGMDDKTAKIFALCMQIALTIAAVGVSVGSGAASVAGTAARVTSEVAQKAASVTVMAQRVLNFASAGLSMAKGATSIANTVINYKVESSKVTGKELEAILERIREAIEMERALVQNEMERANTLMEAVANIVKNCNQTNTNILTASPAMA